MIGSNRVVQHHYHTRSKNILNRGRFLSHILEERRLLNIGGIRVPLEKLPASIGKGTPALVALKHRSIVLSEDLRRHSLRHYFLHLLLRGPDVAQVDGFAVDIGAKRLRSQIDIDGASQSIRDNQWRRSQEAGAHLWMNAPLKVAVAAQYSRHYKIIFLHSLCYRIREWTAVTDASGTSEADQVKP